MTSVVASLIVLACVGMYQHSNTDMDNCSIDSGSVALRLICAMSHETSPLVKPCIVPAASEKAKRSDPGVGVGLSGRVLACLACPEFHLHSDRRKRTSFCPPVLATDWIELLTPAVPALSPAVCSSLHGQTVTCCLSLWRSWL